MSNPGGRFCSQPSRNAGAAARGGARIDFAAPDWQYARHSPLSANERRLEMAYYLEQVAYSAEGWQALVNNP